MPGARCARSLVCEMKKAHKHSHHGHTGNTRHSPRNGFTAYIALSPVTGLSCHRRLRNTFRTLDASVGASGPHDFAVHGHAPSSEALPVSTASRPAFVTIASRPSGGTGRARHTTDLHFGKTEIFLREGWTRGPDTPSQTAPDGQITCVSRRSPEERSDIRAPQPRMALRLCGLLAGLLDAPKGSLVTTSDVAVRASGRGPTAPLRAGLHGRWPCRWRFPAGDLNGSSWTEGARPRPR
jgi:hypothetical protein